MPSQVEQKVVDPEAELSNLVRRFKHLAPECCVAKRAGGIPQLAPQEKQIGILKHEMKETKLCIALATKGLHALRDSTTKIGIGRCIMEYEHLESELRDEKSQQLELDLMNYLTKKTLAEIGKIIPSEGDELARLENSYNRLRRIENRLDLTTKRFCVVNTENLIIREEIHRFLVERNSFNLQWNRTINKLVKGKEYLMDVLEIAEKAFGSRDEACRILETLNWRGLCQLNKDIAEMQSYDSELNHLAKLEEFLRVKGSKRICEAEEKEEIKRLEEIARCEREVARYDALLEEIFEFAGSEHVTTIIENFNRGETENYALFVLLCEVMQEFIMKKRELEMLRQRILDQHDMNLARQEQQEKRLNQIIEDLTIQQARTEDKSMQCNDVNMLLARVLKGFDDLVRLSKCNVMPLLTLLGNHTEVNKFNVHKFIKILEVEVKSVIQVAYSAVKPPAPTPGKKGARAAEQPHIKLVADPVIQTLRPNKIENLVPYQPCAYCVEDYLMNLVYETPATPAEKDYIDSIFRLEKPNTKFGIFTLTIPTKRHPYRDVKKGD